MHIWGPIFLHPLSLPVADQLTFFMAVGCRYTTVVYVAVLKPTWDDLVFLADHIS